MNIRVLALVAVVALLVLVVASFSGVLQLGARADADTVGIDGCGIGGEDATGGGQFRDLPTDARTNGELFSSTTIFYSWFQDGDSRPVTVAGKLVRCGALGIGPPEGVYYRFSYSEDALSWVGFVNDRIPSGAVRKEGGGGGIAPTEWNAPAFEFLIDGFDFNPCDYGPDTDSSVYVSRNVLTCTAPTVTNRTIRDGAILRVEMFTFQRTQLEGEGFWRYFAKDEVTLRSAIPEVSWSARGYKIGETALVRWDIPVIADERGQPMYFLTVRDMNTNLPLAGHERIPLGTTSGSKAIPVDASLFSQSATCQNRLRASILTQLINADQEDASVKAPFDVVLGVGEPPVVSRVDFNKPEYFEGDTVTITYASTGTVTKYHVTAHIGGLVAFDKDVNGTSVSFTAPRSGILEVEVTAYNGCQPSDVRKETATVGNVLPDYCEAFPQHPACAGARFDFAQLALGLVVVVLGILLLLFARVNVVFVAAALIMVLVGGVLVSFAVVDFLRDLGPLWTTLTFTLVFYANDLVFG